MSASTKLFVVKVFQNGTVAFLKGFDSEADAGYAAGGIQGGMAVKG